MKNEHFIAGQQRANRKADLGAGTKTQDEREWWRENALRHKEGRCESCNRMRQEQNTRKGEK